MVTIKNIHTIHTNHIIVNLGNVKTKRYLKTTREKRINYLQDTIPIIRLIAGSSSATERTRRQ